MGINSKEYRKPDWLIKMEEIKERLAATEQAPKFIREIKESRVKEGMRARFEAVFAGNPKPEITWWYNGRQLEETSNMQIKIREDTTSLTILECTSDLAGYYECKAISDLGQDKTRASLTVNKATVEEKKAEKKTVKKTEEKKEAKVYDWKKSVKKVEKKEVKEEPKAEKVQLKKPKHIEKPKEEPKEGVQLKPTPQKKPKEEEKKEGVKLKPVPAKQKAEEEPKEARKEPERKAVPTQSIPKES